MAHGKLREIKAVVATKDSGANLGNVVSVANATDEVTEAARKANTVPAAGEVAAVVAGAAQAMVFLVDLQLASRDRSSAQIISRVIYP
jgi:hypothetical protein